MSYFRRFRILDRELPARLDHVQRQLRPQPQLPAFEVRGIARRVERLPQRDVPRRVVGILDVPARRVQHLRQVPRRMQVLPHVLLRASGHVELVACAVLHALRHPRVPQVENVAVRVRVGVVRLGREPCRHHLHVVAERPRVAQAPEPFEPPPRIRHRRSVGERGGRVAIHDWPEVRAPVRAALGHQGPVVLLHLDGHVDTPERARPAFEDVVIGPGGVEGQREDVAVVGVVVGLHVAEAIVEAGPQPGESHKGRAVEVEPARHLHVRFPVELLPAEVRIAEQHRRAAPGLEAGESDGVGAVALLERRGLAGSPFDSPLSERLSQGREDPAYS